jgi:hypothetical protein
MTGETPKIADAVLYEGHLLYPYQQSALKNQHRYPFGTLYPPAFCEAHGAGDESSLRLECLLLGAAPTVAIRLRFLQDDVIRDVHDAVEFDFGPIRGRVTASTNLIDRGVHTLGVDVTNESPFAEAASRSRDEALAHAIVSPHMILTAQGGVFASIIDPPPEVRDLAAGCRSRGTWPVLLGRPGENTSNLLLAAPIILYDHPEVAPESPGDFFDGTEIDELLTLRLLTLTDAEKHAIAAAGGPARELLERTEALGLERLRNLHGATVRLRPTGRADILDLALAGKEATVHAVERDYEGRTYIAVTLNDDPGRELGAFGHRFFMRPDEVELL